MLSELDRKQTTSFTAVVLLYRISTPAPAAGRWGWAARRTPTAPPTTAAVPTGRGAGGGGGVGGILGVQVIFLVII